MIADLSEIRQTENKGLGLFAKQFIPKGTLICFYCEKCKNISENTYDSLSQEEKEYILEYVHAFEDGHVHIDCDEAKHMNHSCNSSILPLDKGKGIDIVVRNIENGEEATYDYRVFSNKKYNFHYFNIDCLCGEDNCCGIIKNEYPIPKSLLAYWDKKIEETLKYIEKVKQPLYIKL